MPTYEYVCKSCKKDFTVFLSLKEYEACPTIKCNQCDKEHVERKITSFSAKTSRKS
jgi:putative FmdB family regulatory protein